MFCISVHQNYRFYLHIQFVLDPRQGVTVTLTHLQAGLQPEPANSTLVGFSIKSYVVSEQATQRPEQNPIENLWKIKKTDIQNQPACNLTELELMSKRRLGCKCAKLQHKKLQTKAVINVAKVQTHVRLNRNANHTFFCENQVKYSHTVVYNSQIFLLLNNIRNFANKKTVCEYSSNGTLYQAIQYMQIERVSQKTADLTEVCNEQPTMCKNSRVKTENFRFYKGGKTSNDHLISGL